MVGVLTNTQRFVSIKCSTYPSTYTIMLENWLKGSTLVSGGNGLNSNYHISKLSIFTISLSDGLSDSRSKGFGT
ncbi:hypothetical protein RRG08_021558 [Elysia crispata]|uniref:Uncharacterized protein n=1 Tax=Elysia crispata TaxID=231223 RepID=A0AAE0XDY6_9GAST|nr:hypothetical protein RRG08_021558 [Elysia crispata]